MLRQPNLQSSSRRESLGSCQDALFRDVFDRSRCFLSLDQEAVRMTYTADKERSVPVDV